MSAEEGLERLVAASERLRDDGIYVLLSHRARFLNPLVSHERERLADCEAARDEAVIEVLETLLPDRLPGLPRGIYFPAPIARALRAEGAAVDSVLRRFFYEMIHIDEDQAWSWRGQRVAERTRRFFLENLSFEPELDLYFFEYRVHERWWDKSYLDTEVTPLVARSLEELGTEVWVGLDGGQRDRLDLEGFRLDRRERLFGRTLRFGEALFSDALRFRLLRLVSEDLRSLGIAGGEWPLSWAEPGSRDGGPLA